jgi:hypothetical protein
MTTVRVPEPWLLGTAGAEREILGCYAEAVREIPGLTCSVPMAERPTEAVGELILIPRPR